MTNERHDREERAKAAAFETLVGDVRSHTRHALAQIGLRLAHSIAQRFGVEGQRRSGVSGLADPAHEALVAALAFAEQFARDMGPVTRPVPPGHPLPRLEAIARTPSVAAMLNDMVLLSCLPEAHEGFATLCRLMHPDGVPRPTGALALHWLESEAEQHIAYAETFALRDQMRLDRSAVGGVAEQLRQTLAKRAIVARRMRQPVVEDRLRQRPLPRRIEQSGCGAEVEDLVADGATDARFVAAQEYAERQVLDREIGMTVGAVDPAAPRRIMGFVQPLHHRSTPLSCRMAD